MPVGALTHKEKIMKRKFLVLTIAIVALIAILAVSASADVIYKDAKGNVMFTGVDSNSDRVFESYTGSFPNTDEQGNALTWYIVSSETVDTNTVHTVASFLTIDTTGEHASLSNEGVYKYVNQAKELSIVSAYFPNNSNILTLNLSSDGYGNTYSFTTDTSNLLFLTLPNTLTVLPGRIAQVTPIIDCTIDENAPFTSISATAFYQAKNLRSVDIPKNVTIIYSNGHSNDGYPFYDCSSLVDVDFAENSKLETIQQHAFNKCVALQEITIPNSVVNLGNNVFMYCSGLVTVRLGANAGKGLETYNVQSMLYGCNSLKYVYMSDTMVPTTGSHLFDSGAGKMVIFYTGTQEQYETLKATLTTLGNNGKFVNATAIEWDATQNDQYYKDLATNNNKNYVVYGYNKCNAFYNAEHNYGDVNSCMVDVKCSRECGNKIESTFTEHAIAESIVYANGFDKAGVYNCICKNADYCTAIEGYIVDEPTNPIITFKGYSVPELASYFGINAGYKIDADLLTLYESLSGEKVTVGLLMVNAADVGIVADLIDADAKLVTNVRGFSVTMVSLNYEDISIEIKGFDKSTTEGNYYKLSLVSAIFVKTGDDIEYLQDAIGDETVATQVQTTSGTAFDTITADRVYLSKQ